MITVFFWEFVAGRNVGHASLLIGNGSGEDLDSYVSWWPVAPLDGLGTAPADRLRTLSRDQAAEGSSPTRRVTIPGLDETAMRRAWREMRFSDTEYQLLRKNCSWAVKSILDAGTPGFIVPLIADAATWQATKGLWVPRTVFGYANMLRLLMEQGQRDPSKPRRLPLDWRMS